MEVEFAASMKCSDIMFTTPMCYISFCGRQGYRWIGSHSPLSCKFFRLSFALSKPPEYPIQNVGGSWLYI
jgi:hypothetical protein